MFGAFLELGIWCLELHRERGVLLGIWSFWRSQCLAFPWFRLAHIDAVLEAFRTLVRLGFHDVDTETRAGQGFAERFFVRGRPESDAAARLQGIRDSFEPAPAIEP